MRFRDGHDLDELSTSYLAGTTGSDVLRVAGDPEWFEPEAPGKRDHKTDRPSRVSMTTVSLVDRVSDVPSVEKKGLVRAYAEAEEPDGR